MVYVSVRPASPPLHYFAQLGGDTQPVRLFEFWWDDVRAGDGDLKWAHEQFNQAFVQAFPKLLYTAPFTSYTASSVAAGSRIQGLAETRLDDATLQTRIKAGIRAVGIEGDDSKFRLSAHSIEEIQGGANLDTPGSTVNPLATTDGVTKFATDLKNGFEKFAIAWGISQTVLLVIGGVVAYKIFLDD